MEQPKQVDSTKHIASNTIDVDEEELKRRQERIKRFGIVEPLKSENSKKFESYRKRIGGRNNRRRGKNSDYSDSESESEIDPDKIQPKKNKDEYKINVDENAEFVKKRLTLFGVNLMSTDDIEEYFNSANYKVKKICWINDYSCIVEFDTEPIALEAFQKFTQTNINPELKDHENFDWKSAKPFPINGKDQEIQIRVSENKDLMKKSGKDESVFYKFYNSRRKNVDSRYFNRKKKERSRSRDYNRNDDDSK